MTDIVERLRKDRMPLPYQTVLEAADEIERLRLALKDAISCLEQGIYDLRLEGYLRTANILEECAGRCRRDMKNRPANRAVRIGRGMSNEHHDKRP